MAYTGPASGEIREPGARRKKLAGYLRAANELRQSYFQGGDPNWAREQSDEDHNGAFPDAAVVRSGNEEMMLFPSYAKKHVRTEPQKSESIDTGNDAEYWQRQWDKYESDKGVIEVEVRGWIYNPQRGPHTRRQRLMIGLARQLSGITAPSDASNDGSSVPSRSASPPPSAQEEDLIQLEAEHILHEGKKAADAAGRGAFSEKPGRTGQDVGSFGSSGRAKSSDELQNLSRESRHTSFSSEGSGTITPIQKRDSWFQPSRMSAAELATANKHLLARLRPFMATPLVDNPVKAFFYNDTTSRQRTCFTNPSGHFHVRTVLDFIPTHVRVLAGDNLSATEEVIVTAPRGVSLISDIDDTVKHTSIVSGAREIFRNAFIRDLGELTINGVREWYTRLANMGVKMHYVSNSPWQMYPVLTSFFKTAGLPRGSFHLKQYSGMLQGIFEPVAERKKSSLDRIMKDFPLRKFILVGDSGEADLEVYTDVVLDNPGRILGVFIRDVTTPLPFPGYFDSSDDPGRRPQPPRNGDSLGTSETSKKVSRPANVHDEDADLRAAIAASLIDMEHDSRKARRAIIAGGHVKDADGRPTLPQRTPSSPLARSPVMTADEQDLIDFSDEVLPGPSIPAATASTLPSSQSVNGVRLVDKATLNPPRPPKPQSLRSVSPGLPGEKKPAPPVPRRPSSSVKSFAEQHQRQGQLEQGQTSSPLSQMQRQESIKKVPPPLPARRTYKELAKEKINSVMSSSPTFDSLANWQRPTIPRSMSRSDAIKPLTAIAPTVPGQRNPSISSIPDRPSSMHQRVNSSSSISASRKMLNRMSTASSDDGFTSSPGEAGMSRKEILWAQRWRNAKGVMDRHGVTLKSWRVGSDVEEITVKLVEAAQKEFDKENGAMR